MNTENTQTEPNWDGTERRKNEGLLALLDHKVERLEESVKTAAAGIAAMDQRVDSVEKTSAEILGGVKIIRWAAVGIFGFLAPILAGQIDQMVNRHQTPPIVQPMPQIEPHNLSALQ